MAQEVLELTAEVLRALGHPLRLNIVRYLQGGERCVCEIVPAVGAEQSVVSKHLALLRQAGVVASRKEGVRVIYWVEDPAVFCLLEAAEGVVAGRVARVAALAKHYPGGRI